MPLFQTDERNHAFIITIAGFFGVTESAGNFVDDLKKEVAKIRVQDYKLIVDSSDLRTFKPEILPVLETSYGLYMSLGFQRILMVTPQRVTPRLQLRRIAKKTKFTGEFVENLQLALKE